MIDIALPPTVAFMTARLNATINGLEYVYESRKNVLYGFSDSIYEAVELAANGQAALTSDVIVIFYLE